MYAAASWRRAPVRPGRPGRAEVAALLRDGHRLSVRTIALGVVPLTTTAIAARLGSTALGGQQIAMRIWFLLALSLDALAVPAPRYVTACLGAGDQDGAHRVGQRSLRLGLVAGAGLGVVTAALAFGVPVLFTSDAGVRHAALVALLVAAVPQPLAALAFVFDGLILGLSDYVAMRRAMILAIGAYVPVAALVLRFHGLGLPGIWTALGLWLAARAARAPSSARQRIPPAVRINCRLNPAGQHDPASARCCRPAPAAGASRGPGRRRGRRAARTPGPGSGGPPPAAAGSRACR